MYFNFRKVHLYCLYNVPTNAQLINNLFYYSILHCPYKFRRYCVIFPEDDAIGDCNSFFIFLLRFF